MPSLFWRSQGNFNEAPFSFLQRTKVSRRISKREALNDLHEGETEAERGQGKSGEAPKGPKRRNFVENGKSLMVVEPEV